MAPELARALNDVDPVELGSRVKAARIAAGLTQPELAGADASVAFLSRIETGQRRPRAELLGALAARLGVTLDYLVRGDVWEVSSRLELQLDHAELFLAGGEAESALAHAREVLSSPGMESVPSGPARAKYIEAAALDAMGLGEAVHAFQAVLERQPDSQTHLKAATALCRIWREQGELDRAIGCAQHALDMIPRVAVASEEGIRLTVTLAAALFMAGRTDEAADICDRAIAESERLSSPVARASAYWNASMIRAESGQVTEALGMAKRALHLMENTERVRDIARLRTQLVAIMLQANPPRLEDANEQLRLADTELDWSEANPSDRARHELVNAQALFMAGDGENASRRALIVLEACGDDLPLVRVDALALLGQVAWRVGDLDEARGAYRRAIAVLTGVGADRGAGQVWFELGTLAGEAGLHAEAADAFRRAAASTGLRSRLPVIPETTTADTAEPAHVV